MCGIVGIIAKRKMGFMMSDYRIFEQMLWADQLRGTDGTGIFYPDAKGDCVVHKEPVDATTFCYTKEYAEHSRVVFKDAWFVIGHNRASTKGANIYRNTHPFVEGNITLIHNGTLPGNHDYLAKNIEVDSHAITKHMSVNGYKKTLEIIKGAFALVWYNKKDKKLNMVRNSERPLFLLETKDLWFISSEVGLANWISGRNNVDIIKTVKLEVGEVYSFTEDNCDAYVSEKVTIHVPPPVSTYYGYNPVSNGYLTANTPVVAADYNSPILGEKVIFSAYNYESNGSMFKLLGAPDENQETEINDVFYYPKDKAELDRLFKEAFLEGIITQIITKPNVKGVNVLVRNVKPYSDLSGVYSKKDLTKRELLNLKTRCDTCGGFVNKNLDFKVERNMHGNIDVVYCHECAPAFEEAKYAYTY